MNITVHGTQTKLVGKKLEVGKEAPAVRVLKLDNQETVIGMLAPTLQMILSIPSLKTMICSLGAVKFNEIAKKFDNVRVIIVTTDEVEFLKEYIVKEKIDNIEVVVDSTRSFAKKYGLLISEGMLKDRLARAVYIINTDGIIVYKEMAGEVSDELNYKLCEKAIKKSLIEENSIVNICDV